jgi:hypothetical protein
MPDIPTLATTPTPSAAPSAGSPPVPAQHAAPAPSQRVTPGTPEWAALTQEQRHSELRGPENPRARGHSPAIEQREAAAARAAGEPPAGDHPEAPAANSAEKVKIGKYEVSESELASMMGAR